MSTTVYLPMPEFQAIAFLRDREYAFKVLLDAERPPLPCEVVLGQDGALRGFCLRPTAVEFGRKVYPNGFAMLRLVLPKLVQSRLAWDRKFGTEHDPESGSALYRFTRDGVAEMAKRAIAGEVELMVDEIFPRCAPQSCLREDVEKDTPCCKKREDGGDFSGFGGGPSGFGGC